MPKNISAKSTYDFYFLCRTSYFLVYSKCSINAEHIHTVFYLAIKLIIRFYVYD